jgi:VanZ family protein
MNLPRSRVIALRAILFVVLAAVMYLATRSGPIPIVDAVNDKVNHILAFGALALLLDFSFPAGQFGRGKFLLLLCVGLLIEFIQYFLPLREASVSDVMADSTGLAIYWLFHSQLRHVPLFRLRWQ